ncbi:MAG: spore coat associated protein CotJA [Clostridia bacterium]|nr:spore coat associated protein CotJA [Clostridia bacterium]
MNNKCMPDCPASENMRPYAQAFVITQKPGEDMYEPEEALAKGTIYPALYKPYTFWRFKK